MITKIINEIIDEGNSFHWINHLPEGKVEYILSTQIEVNCAYINDIVIGFYLLHPNSSGRCEHIANALYAVKNDHRHKGIGKKLVEHSLETAKKYNFMGMQYNSVVESNNSIKIYEKLGFEKIGIIKNGFKNINGEYKNMLIFYKEL
jgi:L-amino acid N-acyltransferase YncA